MLKPFKTAPGDAPSVITTFKQLEVLTLLYDKGPLRAKVLNATGSLLGLMGRRGLIEPVPTGNVLAPTWRLTAAGRKETRRWRKLYNNRPATSR